MLFITPDGIALLLSPTIVAVVDKSVSEDVRTRGGLRLAF